MKLLDIRNGWAECPRYWWRYLLLPLSYQRVGNWASLGLFGFVFFLDFKESDQ